MVVVECGFCHKNEIEVKQQAPDGKVYACDDCQNDVIVSQYIEPEYTEEESDYIRTWAI